MVFIDQHAIQSVSLPLRVEPSPFMLKNKRADHERTLEGWVKGCYHPATKLKRVFDWLSLVISFKFCQGYIYESKEKEVEQQEHSSSWIFIFYLQLLSLASLSSGQFGSPVNALGKSSFISALCLHEKTTVTRLNVRGWMHGNSNCSTPN